MTAFRISRRAACLFRVLAVVAMALAGLLLAACGGGNKGPTSTPSTVPGAGTNAGTVVQIVPAGASWKFVPDSVTVATGGAVTWTNTSDVAHNVVFTDASVK